MKSIGVVLIASIVALLLAEIAARVMRVPDERGNGSLLGVVLPPYAVVPPGQPRVTDRAQPYDDLVVDGSRITVGDIGGDLLARPSARISVAAPARFVRHDPVARPEKIAPLRADAFVVEEVAPARPVSSTEHPTRGMLAPPREERDRQWVARVVDEADLLAEAAIPGMLILLGVQLRSAPVLQTQGVILRSVAIRLLASPVIAWLLCLGLSITGVERNVLILQAAMPTAVMTSVLATEFDTAPRLVASIIFFSTLLSMVTLSFVLWWML